MTKPNIPNADLIRAVLDGKVLQIKGNEFETWFTSDDPRYSIVRLLDKYAHTYEFRIRPESLVMWAAVDRLGLGGMPDEETARRVADRGTSGPAKVLRLELDPDTLKVISAETEEP